MRFPSETSIFKFFRRSVDHAKTPPVLRLKHSAHSISFVDHIPAYQRQVKLISNVDDSEHINGPFQKVLPAKILLELVQQLKQLT